MSKRLGRPSPIAQILKKWTRKIPDKMFILVLLRKDWCSILNGSIGNHTYPEAIQNGILIINVDDPIWIQELSLMHDELYTTVRSYLRDDRFPKIIRKFRFQNGPVRHETRDTKELMLYLSKETEEHIMQQTASVEDPELREALIHYFVQSSLILTETKYAEKNNKTFAR